MKLPYYKKKAEVILGRFQDSRVKKLIKKKYRLIHLKLMTCLFLEAYANNYGNRRGVIDAFKIRKKYGVHVTVSRWQNADLGGYSTLAIGFYPQIGTCVKLVYRWKGENDRCLKITDNRFWDKEKYKEIERVSSIL